ncbi:DUF885 domain-containing protein [Phenylobacterium sp.]|jgi:uncharacterized protein (DUF885 family)|uniref:DUF885 domain-containing protein n=1 Tax=Phenylobacterium sp. TaxID=1871053 RepID=UPI002E310DDF|nr:DUF885 family protein [Phenylobacterium sp.]HEX4710019.1 DUF885 family protein [Phenylobacterium sp.]
MLNRRAMLLATGAAAAAAGLAPRALAAGDPGLASLLDQFFQEGLALRPESATQLGLDKGANAGLKAKLNDGSTAGRAAARAQTNDQLRRLQAIDRARLSGADRLNYDVIAYTRKSQATLQRFEFGGSAFGPSTYVISQLTGVYQSVPDFLDTKHTIATAEDADAYLSRLGAFGDQLNADTDRQRHDVRLGIVPPDFMLDLTLDQLTKARAPADKALVVTSIARRAAEKGLGDRYGKDAAKIYNDKVLPALERQLAETKKLRAGAVHDAGVWRFKEGPAFYEAALHSTTTTQLSPEEVHKIGLDQGREISSRIDGLLKAQGLTQGSVGERIKHLYADPKQLFPNTDAGKVEAIAYCNRRLDEIRPRLPTVFNRLPPYKFEVRRVPVQTEAGAASAFSQGAALDGSRPGIVYFNLHDSAEWPKFCLSTTIFHEGLPGHQLEGGLALSNADLPLIRKNTSFSGYGEGWALYSEQLADEIGMYDDDPLGRIGYLKFQLFRANRLVVDTGIHHMRWSREQAIARFVENEGEAPGFAAREVERYCATPGQACSYKLGHTTIVNLRTRAKAALGAKFEIKDFHEAVLSGGRVPLDILDQIGDAWIASRKAA